MNFSIIPIGGNSLKAMSRLKKFLIVMKLTSLILLISLVQVSAKSLGQITIKVKNAPIEQVLQSIEKQTGYAFLYNEDQLKNEKITLDLNNVSLNKALVSFLKVANLDYKIVKKNITLLKKENNNQANAYVFNTNLNHAIVKDTINVSGVVVDSLGKGIPGVSIRSASKGTLYSASTSGKGEYHIYKIAKDATLEFSAVGYISQRVKVEGRSVVNITLKQSVTKLNEVTINTGIYTRKANSYTGSTLVIKGDDLKRVGNANVFQALKNISPSLVLENFDMGSDPNALPDLQLRGTSTFPTETASAGLKGNYEKSPNQPLFILDGFEATTERIFDLDLNRIESITILKDAASKAIYGSKAANGVIVVETKKISGGKTIVTYNGSVDLELPDLSSYNLTNSLQKLEAERIDGFYLPSNNTASTQIELQQLYNARKKLAMEGLDTYWLAKPLQNGVGQKHAVSIEMGGPGLNVLANVAYKDVTGAMIGSFRENISGDISLSYRVNKLIFRNITSVNANNTQDSPYGTFSDYAKMNPYWRAENADGSIPFYAEKLANGIGITNPLYNSTLNSKSTTSYLNFTNNFYLEWKMLEDLKMISRIGVDLKRTDADEFYPSSHTMFDNTFYGQTNLRGSYQVNNGKSATLSGDVNFNYSKQIDKHVIFANGGFNISEYNYNEIVNKVIGFSSDRMSNILFGKGYATDTKPSGSSAINRELGFLGTVSYMYDNRFLSDFTARTNASSQFGADKRWAKFWSAGLGWNVHNESFMKNLNFVDQFKIRGSIGSTGNSNFLTNQAISTYNYYVDQLYQGFPGSTLSNLANSSLQWESKFDYNAGFDAKIKNLTVKFDYYQSFTKNLITSITTPTSTGFSSVKENLGKVKNTGLELYASYLVLSNKDGFLNISAGIETNKNKIVELSNAMKAYNANMDKQAADQGNSVPVKKYVDGLSMNAIWTVPSLGIDPSTGKEIYLDRFGNTTYIWNAKDMVVSGNSTPKYQGTFGFNGEYKGIGLTVAARYLGGGQLYNQTLVDRVENIDMNYNVDVRVLEGRWKTPGQNALYKRLGQYSIPAADGSSTTPADEKTRATSRFVQNRNELTIAAVNLYYLFNKSFSKKLGIERLKAGFNMNELVTFSTIQLERGTSYPFAKTLSFNLSATF
jgi:TonB-linked SusC/RagA family outer membrane protein